MSDLPNRSLVLEPVGNSEVEKALKTAIEFFKWEAKNSQKSSIVKPENSVV